MLLGMENNPTGITVIPASQQPQTEAKSFPLLKIVIGAVVVLVLAGTGFGIYQVQAKIKNDFKKLAAEQIKQLTDLQQNIKELGLMIKTDSTKSSEDKTNAVVLGASTAFDEGSRVLGLEDDPSLIKERSFMSKLQEGKKLMEAVNKKNAEITDKNKGLAATILKNRPPTDKTEAITEDLGAIYEYFVKATDRNIRSTALGFNLGVALQLAVNTPDEPSIARMEAVIKDFQTMVREEKNTNLDKIPTTLATLHIKITAADEKLVKNIADLPGLFRQRNLAGIKENLTAFLGSAVIDSNTSQTELVSFWQSYEGFRVVDETVREWQDFSGKI